MEVARFHWADYLVFGISLAISSAVGIFFGCTGKKQATTEEFLMAGRNMNFIPVSVSMFVSWLSAISFLGDPVEVYYFGGQYWMIAVGYALGAPPVAHICAPLYHRMRLVSVYEGGMKAVLWADTIQMLIMLAGLLALVIQGSIRVGGITKVWETAGKGGRLNFNNFNPSPLIRNTFWTYLIGGFFRVFNPYVSAQVIVQRFCTVSTVKKAQIALYLNVPLYLLFGSLFALTGLVMYAFYHDCDPMMSGRITRTDQMVPLLVMDLLGYMPGVPGIFLACVFSASLSTLSSGQNCVAAQVLEDFVSPLWRKLSKKQLSESRAAVIAKIAGVACGAACVGLSFVVMASGGSIFQITITMTGVVMGPLAGVFLLGLFFKFVDALSAVLAFCLSAAVCIWFVIGGLLVPHKPPSLQVDSFCNLVDLKYDNSTHPMVTSHSSGVKDYISDPTSAPSQFDSDGFKVSDLYKWSPMMFAPLGVVLTMILGILFGGLSALVTKYNQTSPDTYIIKPAKSEGISNEGFKEQESQPISFIRYETTL